MSAIATSTTVATEQRVEIIMVDPAKAEGLLRDNRNNRKEKDRKIDAFARVMEKGEWTLSWDAIAIDEHGLLVNGQHRLNAVIKSGVSCPFLIVTGIKKESIDFGDRGSVRRLADVLYLHGEKDHEKTLAALVRALWSFDLTGVPHAGAGMSTWTSLEPTEALATLEKHPNIRNFVVDKPKIRPLSPTVKGVLWYLFSSVDEQEANEFFSALSDGVGLEKGDPRLTLRNRFYVETVERESILLPRTTMALTITAWNAFRNGVTLDRIKPSGTFPRIDGYPVNPE